MKLGSEISKNKLDKTIDRSLSFSIRRGAIGLNKSAQHHYNTTNNKTMTTTLNTAYAVQQEQDWVSYPALQATDYRPRSLKDSIGLGFSEESFELLSDDAKQRLNCSEVECYFSAEDSGIVHVPAEVRWVLLNIPKLFVQNEDGSHEHLARGMKLSGTGRKTCARMFLAAIVDEDLILDEDGKPQVFRLNLKGTKTNLIGKTSDKEGSGTIAALNRGLQKHYKVKGQLLHLVSVQLTAVAHKFVSRTSSESSLGVYFSLGSGARPLTEENQKRIFDLLQDEDLKQSIADPFGIKKSSPKEEEVYEFEAEYEEEEIPSTPGKIPF